MYIYNYIYTSIYTYAYVSDFVLAYQGWHTQSKLWSSYLGELFESKNPTQEAIIG